MRIAVGIISLGLMLVVGFQSFLIFMGAALADQQDAVGEGAVGILVALLLLVGGAFAFRMSRASAAVLSIAGVLGLFVGAFATKFDDLILWGSASVVLAVMSYTAHRQSNRQNKKAADA